MEIIRENYRGGRLINNNYTPETIQLCGLDFVERIPAESSSRKLKVQDEKLRQLFARIIKEYDEDNSTKFEQDRVVQSVLISGTALTAYETYLRIHP